MSGGFGNSEGALNGVEDARLKKWAPSGILGIFSAPPGGLGNREANMRSENTERKQAGRFRKGESGNPSGRPRGARNAATLTCEALLDGQAEALTQKAVEMALAGDVVALRLCAQRSACELRAASDHQCARRR